MNVLSAVKNKLKRFGIISQDIAGDEVIVNKMFNYQGNPNWKNLAVPSIHYLSPDESDNTQICQRLIVAYNKAISDRDESGDGVWEGLSSSCHTELLGHLKSGDCKELGLILSQMFVNPVTTGLMLGKGSFITTRKNPYFVALDWHDKAISLGQAMGVVPMQNPEQGIYGNILHLDSLDIFHRSIDRLGCHPLPPQVGAMFGVRTAEGVVPVNYLLHLYTAQRLSTISNQKTDCYLEIGGGVGLLAYIVASMGAKQYSIIDLPLVNVLQGYVLLKSDLAKSVQLFGEDDLDLESVIKILPTSIIGELPTKSFDIIINQDSLPEMAKGTMNGYLEAIQRLSKQNGLFLSINQEAQAPSGAGSEQGWVHDACRGEKGMKILYRVPYWLRKGYVEELYSITDGEQSRRFALSSQGQDF